MKVTDSKDLLCKIIQNIRFRAPIFNQSLQESEHKKACILSHNVFSHQSVSSSKRASTGAFGGGKIFSQAFACIFGPKELLIIKDPGNTTTGTHNSKNQQMNRKLLVLQLLLTTFQTGKYCAYFLFSLQKVDTQFKSIRGKAQDKIPYPQRQG